jgi:hypothetical protein
MYVHMDVRVCTSVGTYVCIYVYTYICIYLYLDTGWTFRSLNLESGKILFAPPKVQTGSGAQPASIYIFGTKRPGRDVSRLSPSRT